MNTKIKLGKTRKLGKHSVRHDQRTLKLNKYLSASLPAPKDSVNWTTKVTSPWGMMANDTVGDCTCAGAAHQIMTWTANSNIVFIPSDDQVISAYSSITGYDPANPASDQGANELDVLNYWRQTGIAGHKIGAYTKVDQLNIDEVKSAMDIFGGLYIGVALPLTAQGQDQWEVVKSFNPWNHNGDIGSWGGHAVIAVAYDTESVTVITWGAPLKMSWAFWMKYVEEAYAIISTDWINGDGNTPEGLHIEELMEDLNAIQ